MDIQRIRKELKGATATEIRLKALDHIAEVVTELRCQVIKEGDYNTEKLITLASYIDLYVELCVEQASKTEDA